MIQKNALYECSIATPAMSNPSTCAVRSALTLVIHAERERARRTFPRAPAIPNSASFFC